MALNGVLVAMTARGWTREHTEAAWGRSYLDHLRAVAAADPASLPLHTATGEPLGPLIARVLAVPVVQSGGLVRLRRRADDDLEQLLMDAHAAYEACERLAR
jgi:hypothetical protein